MKKKVFLLMILLFLVVCKGCVFDQKLSSKHEMQKYAKKYIAEDAVVESSEKVETGLKGKIWTLYLKRDINKKFIVYEYTSSGGGLPFAVRSYHSNFASVWIKELYDDYKALYPIFENIDINVGDNIYCNNCGKIIFRIDCNVRLRVDEENAIHNFVSYVQDTGIYFEEHSEYGYLVQCKNLY